MRFWSSHSLSKGGIYEGLQGRRAAEARIEVQGLRSPRQKHVLYLQVNRNVGAAEAVNGLFGIADKKELARDG
jgi:hypothetical protein